MTVNYLPKNRSKYVYVKRIFLLAVIFIFVATVFPFLDTTIIAIASPIWRTINKILGSEVPPSLMSNQTQENILLELAGRKQKTNVVVASVLTRPPQTPYDVIIIDAGLNESIVIGSEVSLPEGPILGVVSEVFPKSAKVKLFSASGDEINAVLERNNVPVTLIGTGGGNFRFELPRDMAVETGDRILSSDIAARHLATVGDVSVRPTDSFKEVLAKSPINIFTLRFVFVAP